MMCAGADGSEQPDSTVSRVDAESDILSIASNHIMMFPIISSGIRMASCTLRFFLMGAFDKGAGFVLACGAALLFLHLILPVDSIIELHAGICL